MEDHFIVASYMIEGLDQVKRGAKLHKNPNASPESLLFRGIGNLARVNSLLETADIIKDPLDIYFEEETPKVPILEETAISIAATKVLSLSAKLNLFDIWAEEVSKGKYKEKLAPTKGLARISGLSVINDRYYLESRGFDSQTSYINQFVTSVDLQRPVIGRIFRLINR